MEKGSWKIRVLDMKNLCPFASGNLNTARISLRLCDMSCFMMMLSIESSQRGIIEIHAIKYLGELIPDLTIFSYGIYMKILHRYIKVLIEASSFFLKM